MKIMSRSAAVAFAGLFLMVGMYSRATTELMSSNVLPAKPEKDWNSTVREVLDHEIDAEDRDTSLWCHRKLTETNGLQEEFEACQAKGLEIDRLKAINGKALDEQRQRAEDARIQELLDSPRSLEKQEREQREDADQARRMLRLIPQAFVFHEDRSQGDRITLKFSPNPRFHPWGHEARVFHHMEGTLVLDAKQKRLAEINGRLTSEVRFGGGLLGHLDEGGTFVVKQKEIGAGCWEVTMLDVNMHGKALFFKTIGVQQQELDSDFQQLPASETIRQAAQMTKAKN